MEKRDTSLINLEAAAYAAVALLALGLRWFQLGLPPLSVGEAESALGAYQFIHGAASAAPAAALPALFTGNVAGFTLLGASDSVARWLPLVAGVILALLPYGLRHWLGRGGALAAASLLAISPSAVHFSRTLDGSMLVAACALGMVVGLLAFLETRRPAALYAAAGALGLGMCSSPAFYTLLLILALFSLALYLTSRLGSHSGGWSTVQEAWKALSNSKGTALQAGATLLGVFWSVSTTFALHPQGVSDAIDLIGNWVQGFGRQPGGQPAIYPLLLLVRYELPVVALGMVEAGRAMFAFRSAKPAPAGQPDPEQTSEASPPPVSSGAAFAHTAFLGFWALVSILLITVSGHRPAGNTLLTVVPLALLAGQGIARAWGWVSRRSAWPSVAIAAAVALGLGAFVYLQLTAYAQADRAATVTFAGVTLYTSTGFLLLALLALVLLVGMGAAAWIWRGSHVTVGGGWLALLAALSLLSFKAAWGLNHAYASDPRELMIGQSTPPDVRTFVRQVERLSLDEAGDTHTLPLTVDAATGPVIAWYLRPFDRQVVVDGVTSPPTTRAAVGLAQPGLPLGQAFQGTSFPLLVSWQPWGLGSKGLIRWLFFDSSPSQPAVEQQVFLWVSN